MLDPSDVGTDVVSSSPALKPLMTDDPAWSEDDGGTDPDSSLGGGKDDNGNGCQKRLAVPGSSLREGPPHALSTSYFFTLPGVEYIALYLWLGKDWCWNQLRWTTPALLFSSTAILWLTAILIIAVRKGLYSEAWLGLGVFLWLLANFSWMIGEFEWLWWNGPDDSEEVGRNVAKWTLTASVATIVAFYTFLVPLDVFKSDRSHPLLRQLEATGPPCPRHFEKCCREFRIWSGVHVLSWAVKDCLWAWDLLVPYAVAFGFTVLLTVDLLWRFETYTLQYINLAHAVVVLLWVVANGIWALGELNTEVGLTRDQFREYHFVGPLSDPAFAERRAAGWVFFSTACFVAVFYVHWVWVSVRGKVPSYDDFVRSCDEKIGAFSEPLQEEEVEVERRGEIT